MTKESSLSLQQVTAWLGIAAVGVLCAALVVFSWLNPGFGLVEDYVSKLGARGQPFALWWNLIGFVSVGLLFAVFGWAYGRVVEDRLVGVLFTLFGLGYAVTGMPVDLTDSTAPISKVHTAAICLALAAWLFGLARLAGSAVLGRREKFTANIAAIILVLPIVGGFAGFWSAPMTHRMVFSVVFGWVVITSVRLLREDTSDNDGSPTSRCTE
jgi:hypothetical membrane protein